MRTPALKDLGPKADIQAMNRGISLQTFGLHRDERNRGMPAQTIRIDAASPFSLAEEPTAPELQTEGRVRFLLVNGRQDDGLWGTVGAVWLSEDGERGGFLVHPWALWNGSEFVRGYRSALERGWTPKLVYDYWQREVWRGTYAADLERETATLVLLNELVSSL